MVCLGKVGLMFIFLVRFGWVGWGLVWCGEVGLGEVGLMFIIMVWFGEVG